MKDASIQGSVRSHGIIGQGKEDIGEALELFRVSGDGQVHSAQGTEGREEGSQVGFGTSVGEVSDEEAAGFGDDGWVDGRVLGLWIRRGLSLG